MKPQLYVLAGVNGAGKSSIVGAALREADVDYINPDEEAARIQRERGCPLEEANAEAWEEGRRLLEDAIALRKNHAFETTLGGNTMPRLVAEAAEAGFDVHLWFIGLASAEQHLSRVRLRVAAGGHDIPEQKIRERWDASRLNVIRLMPRVAELRVYDNSADADPVTGKIPPPRLLLHLRDCVIVAPSPSDLARTPDWAKPIVAAALAMRK